MREETKYKIKFTPYEHNATVGVLQFHVLNDTASQYFANGWHYGKYCCTHHFRKGLIVGKHIKILIQFLLFLLLANPSGSTVLAGRSGTQRVLGLPV